MLLYNYNSRKIYICYFLTICMNQNKTLIDLRSFGAIGFQDAPNGLWLGKQNYRPQNLLLEKIIDSCIENEVNIMAITTEDDSIRANFPEDRFGFLAEQIKTLNSPYRGEKIDNILMLLEKDQKKVYLINAETIHPAIGDNWGGLKVQVIGRSMIPKNQSLPKLLEYCQKESLPTLLCNSGQSQISLAFAETYFDKTAAIITHDANNIFPKGVEHLPIIGKNLRKFSRSSNRGAKKLFNRLGSKNYISEVAVSSSHYLHQIGKAGIYVDTKLLDFTSGKTILYSLNAVLASQIFQNKRGYNSTFDVLKFGFLLSKYGSDPDRFKGAQSSYNK